MENQNNNFKSFEELRKSMLEQQLKMSKTISVSSGAVASLSALIAAGNIVIDNNLGALQTGGTAFALFTMCMCYLKKQEITKQELEEIDNPKAPSKDVIQDLINKLRGCSEKYELDRNMGALVSGGFFATAIANVHQIITAPNAGIMATQIALAALASIMSFLNLKLALANKKRFDTNEEAIAKLEESQRVMEEHLKKQTLDVPQTNDIPEEPKVLELTYKPKSK